MNDLVPMTRHLPEKLDSYRRNALTNELVEQRLEENRLAEHLAHVNESIKLLIKECQKKQNMAAQSLHQGFEMKEIACIEEADLNRNRLVTRRKDTLEEIDERALTAEEIKHATKKTMVLKP